MLPKVSGGVLMGEVEGGDRNKSQRAARAG